MPGNNNHEVVLGCMHMMCKCVYEQRKTKTKWIYTQYTNIRHMFKKNTHMRHVKKWETLTVSRWLESHSSLQTIHMQFIFIMHFCVALSVESDIKVDEAREIYSQCHLSQKQITFSMQCWIFIQDEMFISMPRI